MKTFEGIPRPTNRSDVHDAQRSSSQKKFATELTERGITEGTKVKIYYKSNGVPVEEPLVGPLEIRYAVVEGKTVPIRYGVFITGATLKPHRIINIEKA